MGWQSTLFTPDDKFRNSSRAAPGSYLTDSLVLSFQVSALERTVLQAPPCVSHAFTTQEAGASGALRLQAEPAEPGSEG